MKHELEQIPIPGEHEARERAWAVSQAAFVERRPAERRPQRLKPALALAVAIAVLAAVVSPPGRAVLDEIREAVGVERAQQALFSLPSPGSLLVVSDTGVWIVREDGSKRLLGDYREASWSPFGRFVVAARDNELAALEPDGDVRWTLSRPGARSPRWTGTETDTRLAYVDRTGLRVVAGDGTGDRLLIPRFRGRAEWRPGAGFVLALGERGGVRVVDTETGRGLWRATHRPAVPPSHLEWSLDGKRLLVATPRSLALYDARGRLRYELGPGGAPLDASALSRDGRSIAFAQDVDGRGQAWVVPRIRPDASAARRLFGGQGAFDHVSWTPDDRWILLAWSTADQWLFLRANGSGLRAVANVSEQFRSRSFPRIEGWCCAR